MAKVVVIGGGWAGCAAAIAAKKAGADVLILEKTDLLLGLGNVGGIMRNNGRYSATEEAIALGARELFEITDKYATPVSYTHLDVYKRQNLGYVEIYQGKTLVGKVDLVNTKDIQKASYLKMLQRVIDEML